MFSIRVDARTEDSDSLKKLLIWAAHALRNWQFSNEEFRECYAEDVFATSLAGEHIADLRKQFAELDSAAAELRRRGEPVPVEWKTFAAEMEM